MIFYTNKLYFFIIQYGEPYTNIGEWRQIKTYEQFFNNLNKQSSERKLLFQMFKNN